MGHGSRGMWSERGTLTAVWTKETRREQEMEGDEGAECMRTREGSVCHSACPSKRALSTASLWGCPHQSHHLAAASIDHLQSFIPPIKMLSVHITFVFLCWTLLLLHKDTVKKKSDYKHGLFLKSGRNQNIVFCFRVVVFVFDTFWMHLVYCTWWNSRKTGCWLSHKMLRQTVRKPYDYESSYCMLSLT